MQRQRSRHVFRSLLVAGLATASYASFTASALGQDKSASQSPTASKPATQETQSKEKPSEPPPRPEDVVIPPGLDSIARLQHVAITALTADWGFWGFRPSSYSSWTNHSNRLIPLYVFGASLNPYINENSLYRNPAQIEQLYGRIPENTLNPNAAYADQTDVYRLQRDAIASGKKKLPRSTNRVASPIPKDAEQGWPFKITAVVQPISDIWSPHPSATKSTRTSMLKSTKNPQPSSVDTMPDSEAMRLGKPSPTSNTQSAEISNHHTLTRTHRLPPVP
jgi:hypothetical protein